MHIIYKQTSTKGERKEMQPGHWLSNASLPPSSSAAEMGTSKSKLGASPFPPFYPRPNRKSPRNVMFALLFPKIKSTWQGKNNFYEKSKFLKYFWPFFGVRGRICQIVREREGERGAVEIWLLPPPFSPPPSVPRHNYGMRGTNYDPPLPPFPCEKGGGFPPWYYCNGGRVSLQHKPIPKEVFLAIFLTCSVTCHGERKRINYFCLITVTKLDLSLSLFFMAKSGS